MRSVNDRICKINDKILHPAQKNDNVLFHKMHFLSRKLGFYDAKSGFCHVKKYFSDKKDILLTKKDIISIRSAAFSALKADPVNQRDIFCTKSCF